MFKFSNNNFNIYLLTESRKSEAIDKFKELHGYPDRAIGAPSDRIKKTLVAFQVLDNKEKPNPKLANRRFCDKYPMMVIKILYAYCIPNHRSIEDGVNLTSFLLTKIADYYPKMTAQERNLINDNSTREQLHELLKDIEDRLNNKSKEEYEETLNEATEYQKNNEAKILYSNPDKLILAVRAYTHSASCELGYASWCVANPNNDHSFYEYQEENQSAAKVYYIHLFKSNIRKAKFAKFAVEVLKDGGVLIFDRDDESYGSRKFLKELGTEQDLYNVTPREMEELIDKIYTFAETDRYVNPKAKLSENKRRPYRLKIRYN